MVKNLIGLVRDEHNKIQIIKSERNKFKSERNIDYSDIPICFGSIWFSERVMKIIPLYISDEEITDRAISEDYNFFPRDLTKLLNNGILRTSGIKLTDYSVLMSVTESDDDEPPNGRTGALLYKRIPIIVTIGGKEFIAEIKGVGCPDGNNERSKVMRRSDYFGSGTERYGCVEKSEASREFDNLELQRKHSAPTFMAGDSVRAAALFIYSKEKKEEGYIIRLSPSSIRASFCGNSDLPKISKRLLTASIGQQYAELVRLDLLHSTIHPENIVWTGSRYVLTDFADCRRLEQIDDPYDFLNQVLEKINEVKGLTKREAISFYSTISRGLGVKWRRGNYNSFITCIWKEFFAPKVYSMRRGKEDRAKEIIENYKSDFERYGTIWEDGAISYFEDEINLLKHINTTEARESLRIAKERVKYIKRQINNDRDIKRKAKHNPLFFHDLFILPYMKA